MISYSEIENTKQILDENLIELSKNYEKFFEEEIDEENLPKYLEFVNSLVLHESKMRTLRQNLSTKILDHTLKSFIESST
jgi:hypothetical protein